MQDTTASWTPAERAAFAARRRSRNIALGLVLGLLVALFFGITIVKMSDGPAASAVSSTATVAP
ncbi:MAG: hypothetical protein H7267_13665 [Sandarakinorhabdus sp.]|nr:hypothetical protein [Sandarakinorhabdus sp.]